MQRVAIVSIYEIKINFVFWKMYLLETKEIKYWPKLTAEMR